MRLAHQISVPSQARELAALTTIDYADCFSIADTADVPPEQRLRDLIAAMPALFPLVRIVQRGLGLHLAPAEMTDHPIGWDILHSDTDTIVLGADGPFGTCRIVVLNDPERITLATLIHFGGTRGRLTWVAGAPLHRMAARIALTGLPAPAANQR